MSVLGKRTRSTPCPAESPGVQTRSSKRRSIAVLGNDENNNPFITRPVEPAKSASEKKSPVQTRPAKHGASQARVSTATPNNKISSLFSVVESATSVNVFKDANKKSLVSTPQTPSRYRDALAKVAVTPRHRVRISNSPVTPRSPSTPSNAAANVYNQARQLFARSTDPSLLIGREDERKQLSTFVSERIDSDHGGCLYISGPPGTGKSAFVEGVCQDFVGGENVAMATVNCMSIKSAKDLASTLCDSLSLTSETARGADFDFLRTCFLCEESSVKKYIIVLDEIDRLVDLDLNLLYSLFEWSMQSTSSLILIGIANALDLTDRFLPRLKSRSLKPDLLPFMPYTAPQIAQILTTKLQGLMGSNPPPQTDATYTPFLHPAAIQFISKKVASQTGDLRKAFDISHRAITSIESETRASTARLRLLQLSPTKSTTPLMENMNLASPPQPRQTPQQTTLTPSLSHLTIATAPRATIAHAAKTTALVFSNGTTQRLSHLNMQQKAVLCSLATLEKMNANASASARASSATDIFATPSKRSAAESQAPTIKTLFETYTSLCRRENLLHPLTSSEFRDVVEGLEMLSLVARVEGGRRNGSGSGSGSANGSFSVPATPSRTPSRRGKNAGGIGGFVGGTGGDERRMSCCVGFAEVLESLKGPGSEILREMMEA
ncbi:P-loop containing nucleoside triphosphate hydrolase protein [Delphinella strobiligena]|nr:P-loop containing nucleoside triphosphate hydrolase protein [Delphinella strobiligena]